MELIPSTVNEVKNLWLDRSQDLVGKPKTIILLNRHSTKMTPDGISICS